MSFDPDEYLKKNGPQFDPDAYLSKVSKASTVGQTALENYGNAATMGYLPHLQAVSEPITDRAFNLLSGQNVEPAPLRQAMAFGPEYVKARDTNIKRIVEESKENPKAAIAGSALGLVGGALTTGTLAKSLGVLQPAAQSADAFERAYIAGKAGAALGAFANPGDVEGEVSPLQIQGRAKGAAIGAVTGVALNPVVENVASRLQRAGAYFKNLAEEKAFKTFGPTKAEFQQAQERGLVGKLGREALDSDVISPLTTPKRLQGKIDTKLEQYGQEIGQLIDDAENRSNLLPPTGYRQAGRVKTLAPEVKATPVESRVVRAGPVEELSPEVKFTPVETQVKYGKPVRQTIGQYESSVPVLEKTTEVLPGGGKSVSFRFGEPETVPPPAVDVSTVDRSIVKAGKPQIEVPAVEMSPVKTVVKKAGPIEVVKPSVQVTPIRPVKPGRVEAGDIVAAVKNTDEYRKIANNELYSGLKARLDAALEELASKGDMGLKQLLEKRQAYDEMVNFTKMPEDMKGAQSVIYRLRNIIRDKMDEAIGSLGTAAPGALKQRNLQYSNLSRLSDIIQGKVARDAANRAIGLTDTIAGSAAGAATHNPLAGLAVAGANKFGRTFGNPIMALGFDNTSKILAKAPALANLLNRDPATAQSVFQTFVGNATGRGGFEATGPTPADDPGVIHFFRENPRLLENVSDPKLRAEIQSRISRSPGAETPIQRRLKRSQ